MTSFNVDAFDERLKSTAIGKNEFALKKNVVHITPASRVKELGFDVFVVERDLLMCNICNTNINHVHKLTITDHVQLKRHRTVIEKKS
jgi:hypothetical protein